MSFRRFSKFRTFISASRAKRCACITSRREEALLRKRALLSKFARALFLDELLVIHAHLLAREALMNVRKFDNLRKDIAYPAMSPILHLRFWGNMFFIWCSTCIVRTRVLGVRHWRLQAIGKAPRASMLNTKVSIESHQQVENWTLFQMQHSFFDVTLKFTVLQRHFHKFCDTPSTYNIDNIASRYITAISHPMLNIR